MTATIDTQTPQTDDAATTHEGITERGPGFVTASVVDPFGNVLAVMYNQHYLDIVDSVKGA